MVNNNQKVSVELTPNNIRNIESFVDSVCDQLFINDTYYGNILMSVTELFTFLVENNEFNSLEITYNSNYEKMTIGFQPVDNQIIDSFSLKIDFEDIIKGEREKTLFLINSLVDNITIEKDRLSLEYDISALHNEIYQKRKSLLKEYFTKQKVEEKVQQQND